MKAIILILCLIVGRLNAQDCDIEKEQDKFTGNIRVRTPILKDVSFIMQIVDSKDTIYMAKLTGYGNSIHFGEGVIVLFENGMKIERSEVKNDVTLNTDIPTNYKYRVTSYIPITRKDLETFSKFKILAYRLYIYDWDVKDSRANKYREYAYCLLHSK